MFRIGVVIFVFFVTLCGHPLNENWFRLRRAGLIRVHPWFLIQEKFVAALSAKQIVVSAQNLDAPCMTTQRKIQPQPIKLGDLGGSPLR